MLFPDGLLAVLQHRLHHFDAVRRLARAQYLGAPPTMPVLRLVISAVLLAYLLVKVRLGVSWPILTDIAASFLAGEGLYRFLGRTVGLG